MEHVLLPVYSTARKWLLGCQDRVGLIYDGSDVTELLSPA
jgi:hypothetical protein